MNAPTIGALFAGYGGLDLAVDLVFPGAHPAWVSEFDKGPSTILDHRFPGVPNLGDVTRIKWDEVEPVDIITGGSPCQDLSHAGKRAGMRAGTRSGLWASMCDAIDIIRPRLVVWENVRGALSAPADTGSDVEPCPFCVGDEPGVTLRALGRVVGDLSELGYDTAWTGIRAADVGAPHGRWRVFVLAWPGDTKGDPGWLIDRDSRDAAHADGMGTARRPVQRPAESAPARGAAPADAAPAGRAVMGRRPRVGDAVTLLPTPVVNDMGASYTPETWDEWTARLKASHGNGNGHGASLAIEAMRLLPTPVTTDAKGARNSTSARQPGSTASIGDTLGDVVYRDEFGQYAPAVARWEAVIGRPAPSPTEPGKNGAQRLSPRFVEWLMGLPDGWVVDVPGITRNEQLKALGNGVVPQQAAAALTYLVDVRARLLLDPAA